MRERRVDVGSVVVNHARTQGGARTALRIQAQWIGTCLATVLTLAGCSSARSVSPEGMLAYEVSLARHGERLAVAWHGGDATHDEIWLRFADADGRPVGKALQLTDGAQHAYEPDVQPFGEQLLVAWYEKDGAGVSTAMLGCFDDAGAALWRHALSAPGRQGRNPVVRALGSEILVAWIETAPGSTPRLVSTRFGATGIQLEPIRDAAALNADTWNLNAALDRDGTLHVVYDAQTGSRAHELHQVEISHDLIRDYTFTADDAHASLYPDIAISGEQIAVTWFDERDGHRQIYLYTGTLADPRGILNPSGIRQLTHTSGSAIGAYLAWQGAKLAVAWCDDGAGQSEIYVQQFDASGLSLSKAERLTKTKASSLIPAIRPWRDGFAVAWNEYQSGAPAPAGHPTTLSSVAELELVAAN